MHRSSYKTIPEVAITITLAAVTIAAPVLAQTSRADQISAERQKKAASLAPEEETKWEKRINRVEDNGVVESLKTGQGIKGWQPILAERQIQRRWPRSITR